MPKINFEEISNKINGNYDAVSSDLIQQIKILKEDYANYIKTTLLSQLDEDYVKESMTSLLKTSAIDVRTKKELVFEMPIGDPIRITKSQLVVEQVALEYGFGINDDRTISYNRIYQPLSVINAVSKEIIDKFHSLPYHIRTNIMKETNSSEYAYQNEHNIAINVFLFDDNFIDKLSDTLTDFGFEVLNIYGYSESDRVLMVYLKNPFYKEQ